METKQCRLCDYKLPEPILQLPSTPIANQFLKNKDDQQLLPLKLVSCTNCHHYQLNYSVSCSELFNDSYVFVTGTSPVNVKYFEDYAKEMVQRFKLEPGDFVFEIAANDGTLLKAFKKLGMKVLGVDPASTIAEEAGKGKDGVRVIPDFFTEQLGKTIAAEYGNPKLVLANNVLAHLDNVNDIVKGVRALFTKYNPITNEDKILDDRFFVFENSYFGDMVVNNLPDLIYHEHMSHFLVYPLMRMFQANDLCLFDIARTPVHGGSIRGFVSTKDQPYYDTVEKLLQEERKLGLLSSPEKSIKMSDWSKRINSLRDELAGTLKKHKSDGKKIVAYGAPAKFTTLSYILDLNSETIDYVVDDNPLKQETFSPGKKIPVKPFSKLLEDKPDVIVVTAWNFADSIIEKCKKSFGKHTSKFIVPLPNLIER